MLTETPLTTAIIGAGTIGLSWARLFASHGHRVRLFDPRPDLDTVAERLAAETEAPIEVCQCLTEAVGGADLVQESGPENLEAKIQMFADLVDAAPPGCVLASSSSALLPTKIAARLSDEAAARILISHPYNPPHVMPLVEVVPGERTAPEVVAALREFLVTLGRVPVVLEKEAPGFVGNRLQNALLREATHIVEAGIASAEDVDTVLKNSLGMRWAAVGLFGGLHLGGGEAGFRGLMEHIGPSFAQIDVTEPDMSAEGMEPVFEQVERAYPSAEALTAERDRMQEGILRLRAEVESGDAPEPADDWDDEPAE
ncbi:3-hydroxyacyl-CoA dehydrogenase family protein [Brevibacterium luteolum]|uniref:3-hydroxyacyl-CoA dehydrogenase family protein n=1 Tax=Brevibacterium luteolum TaxID=199591 RepID=UPI001C237622|nr:3-hydroxyacyl-CoA dehydrogenase NAD-binding domain-containing protein [Brevibacterium luteolum]MBU8578528.1 hydroxylacyl-CoA dehydrogenase [Brevibacterium luteolum]